MSLHRFDSRFFSGVTILFLALAPPATLPCAGRGNRPSSADGIAGRLGAGALSADRLSLTAVRERGLPLVTCAGGDHGKACLGHGRCAGAGICLIDPSLDSVDRHIRWSWLVAATGADPADYAGRPAGEGPLLILSAGKDGILAPRQTYRLAVALGMARASGCKNGLIWATVW